MYTLPALLVAVFRAHNDAGKKMLSLIHNLWIYRSFVVSSIRNETASRFARSKIGGLWMILNPLSQVAIYALILSNVLSAKLPGIDNKYAYAIYLMAGLLAWSLFSEITTRCLNVFVSNGNLIKKMSFPRITLPAIVIGSSLFNYFLLFLMMVVVFLLLGHEFGYMMLWLIPLTLLVVMLAVGFGLVLGVINVFVRDVGEVMGIVMQFWFWFTPIVYPINILPEHYRHFLEYNPIFAVVDSFHSVILYNQQPNYIGMIQTLCLSLVLLLVGLFLFRKSSSEMVDLL
jgi:lipopolysaccharide transport system permease protein